MDRAELEKRVALHHALCDRLSAGSALDYLQNVVVNSAPVPRPFGKVAEPWQWDIYKKPVQALEAVAGIGEYNGPLSFWRTLPRGCDKTSMVARLVSWVLGYSKRHLQLAVAAGDEEQAGFLTTSMAAELRLNPWLYARVKQARWGATGPGGELNVLTADAPSAFGGNYDIILVDEITHWKKRDLWDALYSGRAKRPGSVLVVITNAGTIGSWPYDLRQTARSEKSTWDVFEAPEYAQLARWMSLDSIDSIRRSLPRGLAKRVLDNVWLDPAEESDFLTRAEVAACEEAGRARGLVYKTKGVPSVRYVASIDYGPKRDRTCMGVVHVEEGLVILDKMDVWQGSPDHPVAISRVEEWIEQTNRDFHNPLLVVDPYQMESTCQRFEMNQQVERFEARGGKKTYEMAENLRSLVTNCRVLLYPGAGGLPVDGRMETLVDELVGLVLKVMPYGYRFDHTAKFHDDRAVMLGMAALIAIRMDPSGPGAAPAPVVPEPFDLRQVYRHKRDWTSRGLWGTEDRSR